ncbi:cation transporter [Priestia sp. Y58]|uniref:heavy-metal-associated domain-containing protein n=1 Tax=Priestia TaxID=2800373 RepID=UPI001C8D6930|nr:MULTISPECIES: heavy-metal-associated domain-containing protein [Priestia]MBX9987286.1 heavy-metal-associated domain-containing protein [Priestia aryabhattai]MBX9998841.1 heavy-metal-associated domain-containing protein [Priestia aryabhattai]MDG0032099.1 cation transporter [Priestia sp. Y58]MDG0060101.1 cation transporter [Priestia sp. P5]UYV54732.1 cation transporter [Priestia megaterium]
MLQVQLDILGMSKHYSVSFIREKMLTLKGVISSDIFLKHKKVKITYNPDVITLNKIINTIEEEGYAVIHVKR